MDKKREGEKRKDAEKPVLRDAATDKKRVADVCKNFVKERPACGPKGEEMATG